MESESPAAAATPGVPSATRLLGLPPGTRALIINCDDFGMCHSINVAVIDAIERGVARSCSLMAPAPWARHAIHLLQDRPDIPFGLHLTLCCETTDYVWGPLSPRDRVPSLLDARGELFTPALVPDLLAAANVEEVELEFRAQIELAERAGLHPTHLDFHCLADGGRDDILDLTVSLAAHYGMAVRIWLAPARQRVASRGLPVIDHQFLDSFRLDLDGKQARYESLLRDLPVGLSEWAVHPGLATDELRSVDPDGWRVRQTDHAFLTSDAARDLIEAEGIVVVDYGRLQEVWARVLAVEDAGAPDRSA